MTIHGSRVRPGIGHVGQGGTREVGQLEVLEKVPDRSSRVTSASAARFRTVVLEPEAIGRRRDDRMGRRGAAGVSEGITPAGRNHPIKVIHLTWAGGRVLPTVRRDCPTLSGLSNSDPHHRGGSV